MENQDKEDKKDYVVGYGKPPVSGRFKPKTSGNPAGRPKLAKAFKTDLQEELYEVITIQESGKSKSTTKQRAFIKRVTTKALNGDDKSMRILTQLISSYCQNTEKSEPEELSVDDKEIIQQFLERGNSNEQ